MRKPKQPATFDTEVLSVLAYEFPFSNPSEIEAKLKRRIQRKKLGPVDAHRVDVLRRMKNRLQEEIGRGAASAFFVGAHGKYSEMNDFDVPKLVRDMSQNFPDIPKNVIESFVPFCVLIYYLK